MVCVKTLCTSTGELMLVHNLDSCSTYLKFLQQATGGSLNKTRSGCFNRIHVEGSTVLTS